MLSPFALVPSLHFLSYGNSLPCYLIQFPHSSLFLSSKLTRFFPLSDIHSISFRHPNCLPPDRLRMLSYSCDDQLTYILYSDDWVQ